jgi:hypothetical protein
MAKPTREYKKIIFKKTPELANIERFCDFLNTFHTKPPKLKPE